MKHAQSVGQLEESPSPSLQSTEGTSISLRFFFDSFERLSRDCCCCCCCLLSCSIYYFLYFYKRKRRSQRCVGVCVCVCVSVGDWRSNQRVTLTRRRWRQWRRRRRPKHQQRTYVAAVTAAAAAASSWGREREPHTDDAWLSFLSPPGPVVSCLSVCARVYAIDQWLSAIFFFI